MSKQIFAIFHNERFVDLTLYQFGYEECEPFHSFGPILRNHYLFHYIISGKGTLHSNDQNGLTHDYKLEAGQGFLIHPKQCNTYYADGEDPWVYVWLEFDGLRAKELLHLCGLTYDEPIYTTNDPPKREEMKDEMLFIANHGSLSSLVLVGHLYLFMDALIRSSSVLKKISGGKLKDFYIREAISYVEQNYRESITMEDMANFCNLNRSYLGKIFQDTLSTSPQQFVIQYRMNKACELMRTTKNSIQEICLAVGYPNQLSFSRTFKKQFGVAPRQWREANRYR